MIDFLLRQVANIVIPAITIFIVNLLKKIKLPTKIAPLVAAVVALLVVGVSKAFGADLDVNSVYDAIIKAIALAIESMPNVTMKECTFILVIINPIPIPIIKVMTTDNDIAKKVLRPFTTCRKAAITPTREAIEPTDRSISASKMTNVIPQPMMPTIETCLKMFIIFLSVRKC